MGEFIKMVRDVFGIENFLAVIVVPLLSIAIAAAVNYFHEKKVSEFKIPVQMTYFDKRDYIKVLRVTLFYFIFGVCIPIIILWSNRLGTPLVDKPSEYEMNNAIIGLLLITLCISFPLMHVNAFVWAEHSSKKKMLQEKISGYIFKIMVLIISISIGIKIFFVTINYYESFDGNSFSVAMSWMWLISISTLVICLIVVMYIYYFWNEQKLEKLANCKNFSWIRKAVFFILCLMVLIMFCNLSLLHNLILNIFEKNVGASIICTVFLYLIWIINFCLIITDCKLFGHESFLSAYRSYTIATKKGLGSIFKEHDRYIVWMKHSSNEWILIPCKIKDDKIDYKEGEFIISELKGFDLNVLDFKKHDINKK